MIENEKKQVKQVFDDVWEESDNSRYKKSILYKIYNLIFGSFNSTTFLFKVLKKELQEPYEEQVILEPGCGTGLIGELISRKLHASQDLLDISPKALEITKNNFGKHNLHAKTDYILASMFEIPVDEKKYDFIWNEGVLEHFSKDVQINALNEFSRVLKDNGKIVIIIPNKKSKPYMQAMRYAKKQGTWEFGYEKPEFSLEHIVKETDDLELIREYSRGFISQFGFYRYYFKRNKILMLAFLSIFSVFHFLLYPLNVFSGYYLVSVIKKKTNHE